MATHGLRAALLQLRQYTAPGGVSDAALLARFVTARDEAAFELLLHRHGPMVLAVCRRLLRHEQDAEDAFQATFLILARKASSVSTGTALAGWLYRVAFRTALAQKARVRKQTERERPLVDVPAREPPAPLDDIVTGLPEKYRAPVVLCHLEGRSYAEASELLGCPSGTIAIRLSRARDLLRERLSRRGLAPCAVAALLAGGQAPAALSKTTVQAALAAVEPALPPGP